MNNLKINICFYNRVHKRLQSLILFLILAFPLLGQSPDLNSNPNANSGTFNQVFESVVLVRNESFLTESGTKPWMKETFSTGWGTGIVIGPNLILTNAHVVMDSKFLSVQQYNTKRSFRAKIKYIAFDCDLAVLEIIDSDFPQNIQSPNFLEGLPRPGTDLLVLGYPNGTENLTVEKGNVLNIEKSRYSVSGLDYRNVIRIKASIVPGNSGGPAIQGDKIVGIAFQISSTSRNIAYLIPTPIIQHFLKDIADGRYDGFPNLGFTFQSGKPEGTKKYLKIPTETTGVLVNTIYPKSSFYDFLKQSDFIYQVDEYPISNEGDLVGPEKKSLLDYIEEKYVGDSVSFYFYRQGKKYKASAKLQLTASLEIYREDRPVYFLNSGLVFQPVSRVFFTSVEPNFIDSSAKYHFSYYIQDELYRYNERDIILSYIFDDPENTRYHEYKFKVVETINGYSPKDLQSFQDLWTKFSNEPIVVKFRGVNLPIIIIPSQSRKINARVLNRYGVEPDEKK
jgi:S1-C subfamily serine protease